MPGYYQNNYNQGQYYSGTPNYSMPVTPLPQQNTNSVMVVFVDGEAGARSYPVAAGNTVMLMDFNSNNFWLKSTDTTGMPQQLRTFEFKEIIQQPAQSPAGVSREEFNSLSDKLDKLIAELGGNK